MVPGSPPDAACSRAGAGLAPTTLTTSALLPRVTTSRGASSCSRATASPFTLSPLRLDIHDAQATVAQHEPRVLARHRGVVETQVGGIAAADDGRGWVEQRQGPRHATVEDVHRPGRRGPLGVPPGAQHLGHRLDPLGAHHVVLPCVARRHDSARYTRDGEIAVNCP